MIASFYNHTSYLFYFTCFVKACDDAMKFWKIFNNLLAAYSKLYGIDYQSSNPYHPSLYSDTTWSSAQQRQVGVKRGWRGRGDWSVRGTKNRGDWPVRGWRGRGDWPVRGVKRSGWLTCERVKRSGWLTCVPAVADGRLAVVPVKVGVVCRHEQTAADARVVQLLQQQPLQHRTDNYCTAYTGGVVHTKGGGVVHTEEGGKQRTVTGFNRIWRDQNCKIPANPSKLNLILL